MTTLQRTAIVVGVGSEQGLGAAIARRFAAEGQRVIVSGRTEAKIARVVRAIVDSGGKAEAFTADATIESEVVALFDFAGASGNAIDLVVFNAGNNDGGIDDEKLNTAAPQLRIERGADGLLNIDAIAEAYWHLHGQHRSAWTHELDLRPYKERF